MVAKGIIGRDCIEAIPEDCRSFEPLQPSPTVSSRFPPHLPSSNAFLPPCSSMTDAQIKGFLGNVAKKVPKEWGSQTPSPPGLFYLSSASSFRFLGQISIFLPLMWPCGCVRRYYL